MLDILLDPLVWVAAVLILTLLFTLFRRRCLYCLITNFLALCLLVVVASPSFANQWLASLEDLYPLRHCDVSEKELPVVVLAGGMSGGYSDFPTIQRLSDSSKNRALAAVGVVQTGGLLFIAGGTAPNRRSDTEADAIEALINPFLPKGVTVIKETNSENTHQNARNLQRVFEERKLSKDIVLVTSAYHMRRAMASFRKHGFEVCSFGVDPRQHLEVPRTALWPQVSALQKTKIAVHEWIGWLYYRQQGFI